MRKYLSLILVTSLLSSNFAYAECDFSKDLKRTEQGYLYTAECHKEVGKMFTELTQRDDQVEKLNKTIELKDLALTQSNGRVEMWRDTTFKLEDRVNTIERMKDKNKVIWFILGIGMTSLAVWGAGQLK